MTDIEEGLLARQIKTQFQIQEEKVRNLVEELKELNDQQQQFGGGEISQGEINQQKAKFRMKAEKIKELMSGLEKAAKGEQRGIVAKHKNNYTKEVERQKRILRSFINQSFQNRFTRISVIKQSKGQGDALASEQLKYFVDAGLVQVTQNPQQLQQQQQVRGSHDAPRVKTISMDQDIQDEDIIDIENQLIDERQQELDQIEKEAVQLNMLVGQMGQVVDEHGKQLDIAQLQMNQTREQVGEAGGIMEALNNQGRSKKLMCLICVVISLVIAVISLLLVVVLRN